MMNGDRRLSILRESTHLCTASCVPPKNRTTKLFVASATLAFFGAAVFGNLSLKITLLFTPSKPRRAQGPSCHLLTCRLLLRQRVTKLQRIMSDKNVVHCTGTKELALKSYGRTILSRILLYHFDPLQNCCPISLQNYEIQQNYVGYKVAHVELKHFLGAK